MGLTGGSIEDQMRLIEGSIGESNGVNRRVNWGSTE